MEENQEVESQGKGLLWMINNRKNIEPEKLNTHRSEKVITFYGGAEVCRLFEEALKKYTANALRTR